MVKKQVKINDKSLTIGKGDLLLLPPDTTMKIGNYPDNQEKKYLGLAFRFDQKVIKNFQLYMAHH